MSKNEIDVDETFASQTEPSICDSSDNGTGSGSVEKAGEGVDQLIANITQLIDEDCVELETQITDAEKQEVAECPKSLEPSEDKVNMELTNEMEILAALESDSMRIGNMSNNVAVGKKAVHHEPSTSSKSSDKDRKGSPVVVLTRLAAGISSMKVEKSTAEGTKLSKKEKWHDDASLSDLSVSDISLSDSEEIAQTLKQDKKKATEKLQGRAQSGKVKTNKNASNVSSSASKKNEKSTDYSITKRHTQGDRGSSDALNPPRKDKHEKETRKTSSRKETKQTDSVKLSAKADEHQGDARTGRNKRKSVDTSCNDEKKAKVENVELFKLMPKPDLVEKVNPRSSSNMKYQLSLSPIQLSDLSNPAFRKFINLASDCAVDFSKKINATGLQNGSVNLYFGDFVAIQSAMHKLCQLPILANGCTISGIIKIIEILPKATKEVNGGNWSRNSYGNLLFNFYSDKAEPLQQLIQLKDRKRAGMKKERAHVHRIPVSLSRDMLSLLFPFSVGVKYLDTEEATQKFYRGPVEIEFESREWMEAVLTCYQNTAFLPGTRTAKTFRLIIKNFTPPTETKRAHQSSASLKDSSFSESNRQQGSSYKPREKGRSAERDKSSRLDQRKRPFPDSRSTSSTARRSAEKQMRINLASESRTGMQQRQNRPALNTNVEAVRRAALARGLDGGNQEVRRILEMQGQLETVQSMVLQQTLEANSLGIACSPAQRALAMGQSQEVLARLNHARQQVMQVQDAQQRMGLGVGAEQTQLLEELRRRREVQEREVQGGYQTTQSEIMIKEGIAQQQQQQRRLEELEQQMRQSQLVALQSGEGQRGIEEAQARAGYVGLPRTEAPVRPFGNASAQNGLLGAGPGIATDKSISEAILAAKQRQAQYVLKQAAGHALPDTQRSSLDQRQGSNVSSQSRSRQAAPGIGVAGIQSRNESSRSSGSTHGRSAEGGRVNAQKRYPYGDTSQLDVRGGEIAARAQHDNIMRLNEGRKPRSLEQQGDKQPQEHRVKRKTRWSDAEVGQGEVAARIPGTQSMDRAALSDKPLDRSRRSGGMDHGARAGFHDRRDKSKTQTRILDDTELCLPVQFGKHAVKKTPAQIIKEKVIYEALEAQKRQFGGQSNFEDRSQKDKALAHGLGGGQFGHMGGGREAERGRANRGRDAEMDRAYRGTAEMGGAYGSRDNEMGEAGRVPGDGMARRGRDDNIGWPNRGRAPDRNTQSSAGSYGFTGGVQNLKEDVGFYAVPRMERVGGALDGSQQHSLDTDGGERGWAERSNQSWLGDREISQGKAHGKRGPLQTMDDDEEYESGWQVSGQSFTGGRRVARPGQYDTVPESKEVFKHGWQQERPTAQPRNHPLDAVQGGYAKTLYPADDYDQQPQWGQSEENRFPYSDNKTRGTMAQAAQRFSPVRLGAIPAKGRGKSTRERPQPVEHLGDWGHGNFEKDQGFPSYQGVKSNPTHRVMGSGDGRDEFHEYGEEEESQSWAGWSKEGNYGPSHQARGMGNKQLGASRTRNAGIGRGMLGQRGGHLQGGGALERDFHTETDYQEFEGGNFDMERQGQNLWPKVRSVEAPGAGLLGRGGARVFSQPGRGQQHQAGYSRGVEEGFEEQYFSTERPGRQAAGLLYPSDVQAGRGVNFY